MANQNFRVKNGLEVGTGVTISGGIVTATTFSGNATSSNYATTAGITTYSSISGISTSVIGGIGNISQLQVSGVSTFQSSVFLGDGDVLYFGDGEDLLIWHNSTDSIIRDNGTGDLLIEGGNRIKLTNPTGTETYGVFNQDGAVELYYDNVKKFETTGAGVTVTGNLTATSLIKSGGTSSQFLKADGSVDSSTYLTSYTETDTLNTVTSRGNSTPNDISVGIITATTFNGPLTGTATTANNLSNAANITTGTINNARLSGNYNIDISGNSATSTYAITSGIATALQNSRTFEITGDIVASPISFNGTGNVSLAATIQPNSVSLGGDTTGDYVQSISGTSNEITVTGGTGESSTPIIAFAPNPTIPGNVTIANDLQVNNNLNVNGNITIGGTSAYIIANDFRVKDADIVLGFTTNISNQDVSNDTTANHGGIAIASTEGNPLVNLNIAGIETLPATYKKIMWFKAGSFAGLNTDAWLSNYAIGIGSTQFPSGTRLAAGSVQFTENDLTVVKNINSSGIITATSLVKSGGTSSQFLKADGSVDSSTYLTTTGSGVNLSGIVTSIVAGTNITVSNSTGRVTIDASGGGGGSSDLVGLSTLGFFSDNQNITSSTTLPSNTLLYTVHKNINVAIGSTITIGSGSTIIMDRLNNLDDVVAISFKGDGSQLTGIPVGDLYELDQISPAGGENTYTPTFNYDTVAVTDPFKLLISVNGIIQSAYVHNTEYVFNNYLLASRTGYTIDYDSKIKFTESLPEGSEVVIKTTSGTTKSTTRKYPFNALDVLF